MPSIDGSGEMPKPTRETRALGSRKTSKSSWYFTRQIGRLEARLVRVAASNPPLQAGPPDGRGVARLR